MRPYSIPAKGYFALWPYIDLGNDRAVALYAVGCRSYSRPTAAYGFTFSIGGMEKSAGISPRMLSSGTLPSARLEAMHRASNRPIVIYQAEARGRITVWRRVEHISLIEDKIADGIPEALEIRVDGTAISKEYNPRINTSLSELARRLSRTVTNQLSGTVLPRLRSALREWTDLHNYDWASMTAQQFDEAWQVGQSVLQSSVSAGHGLAAPGVREKIAFTVQDIHDKNQKYLQNTFLPRTQVSFNQVDERVLNSLTEQAGFWIRDSSGQISESLGKQGRKIIQQGVKDGIGRDKIADELIKQLPDIWQNHSRNYARTVAANVVSRARSYSEVSSYVNAGISYLEVMAMLDERTTDQCRALDGTIIEVNTAMEHQTMAANLPDPQDIKKVAPFLTTRVNQKTGLKDMYIQGTSTKFATIQRSGVGNLDDRGSVQKFMSTKNLNKAGITMPPYHHQCRTLTVPRNEMIQVPNGYDVQSEPTPSANEGLPPKKSGSKPTSHVQHQRPLNKIPQATAKKPVVAGQKIPIDTPPKKKPNAVPKKTQQKPATGYPQTLGQFNKKAKEELNAIHGKVKIEDVKLSSKTGQLLYTYKVPGSDKVSKKWVKVPDAQRKKVEQGLRARDKRREQSKPKAPTPSKHPVKGMGRSTVGLKRQTEQDKRTKSFNKYREASQNSIAKRLENNPEFKAILGRNRTPLSFVQEHYHQWGSTSRDHSKRMHYLQMAVAEEFKLPPQSVRMLKPEIVAELQSRKDFKKMMAGYRAYVREQYNETQQFLKKRNINSVSLFRGAGVRSAASGPKGATFDGSKADSLITTQPANSYSTSDSRAYGFASSKSMAVMIRQEVPSERIFALNGTGLGTNYETEYVVLGGADDFAETVTWYPGKMYRSEASVLNNFYER